MTRRVMNLAHIVDAECAAAWPSIPPSSGARRRSNWAEIDAQVSALAAGLRARGIGKGDRVLVHSKNCDAMFVSMFATFRLGAVWVPTNFRLLPDEVAYLATASGAKGFLCHGDFPDHAAAVAAASPAPEFTWRIGAGRVRRGRGRGGDRAPSRRAASRTSRSSMTIPAGSSSPRARPGAPRPPC